MILKQKYINILYNVLYYNIYFYKLLHYYSLCTVTWYTFYDVYFIIQYAVHIKA